ncbi:hypothetical protein [Sphingomonas abietis]|uniref:CsbD family protein n=1 Tax=Sphingomonas abietis TaxID=3012344 RepID=A0ABY7NMS4_9SPHN|nr:hypothetical protein [Sphingomonas abietis]WBO20811.1 hypothetical protein PBT88_11370 [Sphingomonas abietis]
MTVMAARRDGNADAHRRETAESDRNIGGAAEDTRVLGATLGRAARRIRRRGRIARLRRHRRPTGRESQNGPEYHHFSH